MLAAHWIKKNPRLSSALREWKWEARREPREIDRNGRTRKEIAGPWAVMEERRISRSRLLLTNLRPFSGQQPNSEWGAFAANFEDWKAWHEHKLRTKLLKLGSIKAGSFIINGYKEKKNSSLNIGPGTFDRRRTLSSVAICRQQQLVNRWQ